MKKTYPKQDLGACTGFMAAYDNDVVVGSNIDMRAVDPNIQIYKPDENNNLYGRMIFQYSYHCVDCKATGINEHGLWFDWYEHQFWPQLNSFYKKKYQPRLHLDQHCLATCKNVREVKEKMRNYNLSHMSKYNVFWVDKTGDWVIIEGNKFYEDDKENEYGVEYQSTANFLHTRPNLPLAKNIGWEECKWRYYTADYLLKKMKPHHFKKRVYAKHILESTHAKITLFSNICDLQNGIIYLYFNHDFNNEKTFILKDCIEKVPDDQPINDPYTITMPPLFEPSNNQPPKIPQLYGPKTGNIGDTLTYYAISKDPENHPIYFLFDWGTSCYSKICEKWVESINNRTCELNHTWLLGGQFPVRVKTRDIYGKESNWSQPLYVTISGAKHPRNLPPEFHPNKEI